MSNAYFSPFNFQPYGTEIKTTSYTIPSGYYARVKPMAYNFTIDTVSPMLTATKSMTVGTTGQYYLVGHPGDFHIDLFYSGGTSVTQNFIYVSGATDITLAAGTSLDMAGLGGAALSATPDVSAGAVYVQLLFSSAPSSFALQIYKKEMDWIWVPEATDLDGNRYVVELYRIPT